MPNIIEQVTAPLIKRNIKAMSEKDLADGHLCTPVRFIWKPATVEDAIGAMSMDKSRGFLVVGLGDRAAGVFYDDE